MKKQIEKTCRLCKKVVVITADPDDIKRWENKQGVIQDILHYLPADQRELLISGTCGECFDQLFPPEEE